MAPRISLALFLALHLISFTYTSATCSKCIPTPTIPSTGSCPRDALKIGLCASALKLVDLTVGNPPVKPCCPLIEGLVDLEAAVCLCTLVKANILGINLSLPIDISVLLNVCGKNAPKDFQCA
ncbi:unnamed protein product [Eruca vesicaria subsp. sativa]|uniref:Bifunctional inhibitor/plant lipid transfer protein/seed storage helical domain-containing protein n=1 Tax=Eruca vesicaria subsp. sativa TaxID=29727 RepID=A0ABC8LUY9_ERUVS|nr:unnamed protein product [Eruca vesicaria subsp. sativa]